jgi:hypothetical protein
MTLSLLFIIGELLLMYFVSRRITSVLFSVFSFIFSSRQLAITILTILYFPGTVIHELAHLIVAEVLRVPTGEITFLPTVSGMKNKEVKLGSLQVAECDPLRRYLIGFAPIFFGVFFLSLIIWLFNQYFSSITEVPLKILCVVLSGYGLFSISNNMFSSRKDLEGFIFFVPVLLIVAAAFYFSGFTIPINSQFLALLQVMSARISQVLLIVLACNFGLLLLNGLVLKSLWRLRR